MTQNCENEKTVERIGLFGGTFAPPHLGHVHAVKAFLNEIPVDRLLVMPTAIPPHKVKVNGDTPEQRIEMCRAAFGEIPSVEVSTYEIDKGGVSYTVETLEYLTAPDREIYLLCGTDMFLTLDQWFCAERIFELAHIVCMPRYDGTMDELLKKREEYEDGFGARIEIAAAEAFELSSTEIRERIRLGDDLKGLLPDGVIRVIREQNLYRETENHEGKTNCSDE